MSLPAAPGRLAARLHPARAALLAAYPTPSLPPPPAGDGKCVVCDSYVRPATLVRVCDECNYGSYAGRCVICGGFGVSDAYYCKECTLQEKDVRAVGAAAAPGVRLRAPARPLDRMPASLILRSAHPPVPPVCLQRDGCPKIINLGSAKTDLFYERKKYGFKKR